MYIDSKETVWYRYQVKEGCEEKAMEALEKGIHPDDFVGYFGEEILQFDDTSYYIDNTNETVTLEENDGYATLEAYDEDKKQIFINGK